MGGMEQYGMYRILFKRWPFQKRPLYSDFHFFYKFLVWLGFEIPSENLENSEIELVQYVSDIALKWWRKLKTLKVLLSTLEWCSNNTLDEEAKLYKH